MEIKFTIKKVMDDMGFCYMEVHFALRSPSNNKGKIENCIMYLVKTIYKGVHSQ